jgi:hypothetical protein
MRAEYDFSKGIRGAHSGKRIRIAGDKRSPARTQPTTEPELAHKSNKTKNSNHPSPNGRRNS